MTGTDETLRRQARRRFRWLGLFVPLGVAVMFAAVQVALLPHMPSPAATHWGASGGPDGFGAAWTFPAMSLGIGGGFAALLAGLALSGVPTTSGRPASFKLVTAMIWAFVSFIGVAMLGSCIVQVGVADAHDVPSVVPVTLVGGVAALGLGVVGWRAAPALPPVEGAEGRRVEAADLAQGERAVWIRGVSLSRVAMAVLGVAILTTAGMTITTAILDIRILGALTAATWITGGCCVLVSALVLLSSTFQVRVDAAGLTVRAPLGWPRTHVAVGDIRSVEVVHVSPMGEYGGWGWRYGLGGVGLGIVMRAGEALRVTTTAGKKVTVTVDDAVTGAALLEAMTPDDLGARGADTEP